MDYSTQILSIIKNLKQIQQTMKSQMHAHFQELGLTAPQGMVIFMVKHHGSMKISELSQVMGLSNSTVSGIVDRLEDQGWIKRERSEDDRRVVHVSIAKEMQEKMEAHESIMQQLMSEVLEKATKDELATIGSGLELLNGLLHKVRKGDDEPC